MADNEIVYVPQATSWLKNENFWIGFASSALAGFVIWYFFHDMQSDASQDGVSDEGPLDKEEK